MAKDKTAQTTDGATEGATTTKRKRTPRDPGTMKVGLYAVTLSTEEADALAYGRSGMVSADRREVAKAAREYVRQAVANVVATLVPTAVAKLRAKRHESDLAAARAEAEQAAAKVRELEDAGVASVRAVAEGPVAALGA